jgi:hypothetical protein
MASNRPEQLMRLLGDIFADNIVTAEERDALLESQAELTPGEVREVFTRFVKLKWGEALADGVITEEEKLLLQRVVEELELPDSSLPTRLRLTLRH